MGQSSHTYLYIYVHILLKTFIPYVLVTNFIPQSIIGCVSPCHHTVNSSIALPTNMSQASLLGLPPSLRSRIYDDLLVDALFRLSDDTDPWRTEDRLPSSGKGVRNVWAYLEICQTVRNEIKPLFFSETAFMIDEHSLEFDRWLETIGPEAIGQLKKLTIRCEGPCRE